MRGTNKLPVLNILKQAYPVHARQRAMAISTLDKHKKNNDHGEVDIAMNGINEPIAAFDKPRLPPVLGPLVVLSLLEMCSDGNDN